MTKQRKSGKRPPAKKAPVKASASGSSASSVSLPALGSRRAWSATARFGAVIVAVACVLFYMNIKDVYEAQNSALAATESNSQVTVERGDAALAFRPVEGMGDTGFIFYPGGKVEYEAYAPLMQQMAQRGIFCVLVEMPFELIFCAFCKSVQFYSINNRNLFSCKDSFFAVLAGRCGMDRNFFFVFISQRS